MLAMFIVKMLTISVEENGLAIIVIPRFYVAGRIPSIPQLP